MMLLCGILQLSGSHMSPKKAMEKGGEREKAASEWRRNRQENCLEPAQRPLSLAFLCLHIHMSWQQATLVLFTDGPSVVLGRMFGNGSQGGARSDVVRHSQQSLELFSLTST